MEAGNSLAQNGRAPAGVLAGEPQRSGRAAKRVCFGAVTVCPGHRTFWEGRMKFALLNPNWDFKGSIYFGCRDPHIPLELMFAADQLHAAGHSAVLIDAH